MYKVLKIGGKDYKLEYTVEASLYDDCVSSVTSLMVGISESEDKNDIKKLVKEISNIPKTTLIIFYAGLLEAHGPEGDGTVSDLKDAKSLIRTYLEEHKDDEDGNLTNKIIVKDTTFLAFNYSTDIYVGSLNKKIQLVELEDYIKNLLNT